MNLNGRGFYIWKIPNCEGGDPERIAETALQARLSHVLIKVADWYQPYNITDSGVDLVPPLVKALRSRGIQAWGWQYIYGSEPAREAQMAARRIQALDLDGFVIDAEIEYEQPRRDEAARRYCGDLRAAIPSLPIALSSFRFPTLHMSLPWKVFLEHVDFSMPQVYWEKSHNPGDQLKRTVREFRNLTPIRPIFPTGAAYKWGGWKPTTADLIEYLRTVEEIGLPGTNFWVWEQCRRDLPEFWEIIAQPELPEPEKPPEPPKDLLEQYFDALNARDLPALAALYHPKAVHITAERTLQGPLSIRAWAGQWLEQQMPNARFALTGQTKTLLGRSFTWKADSANAKIPQGRDTITLLDEKILYHYSAFKIV